MRENKSNPELKFRSTERDYKYISRITGRYAGLSLVFLTAGIVLWILFLMPVLIRGKRTRN